MEKEDGKRSIAYFSMEIGLDPRMPTYTGGLGVLAGDFLKSCADLSVPIVGVTLLHRDGYFYQKLDEQGWQQEIPVKWSVDDFLEMLPQKVSVSIEGRTVWVQVWKYTLRGSSGYEVPIYFLDTDMPDNSEWDSKLTHSLYGGDEWYRLAQEVVLGIGGVRILDELGYHIEKYHMNEGHSAMLAVELLNKFSQETDPEERVREHCVFTTHTPVPAGHDKFSEEFVHKMLGDVPLSHDHLMKDGRLNMTLLGLHFSRYINGVALKHGEVSREMFPDYPIDSITNGVHSTSWVCDSIKEVFDEYIPGWRVDPFTLRHTVEISNDRLWQAHQTAKRALLDFVDEQTNLGMDKDVFTIGFARRMAPYKRSHLLFFDRERLRQVAEKYGQLQIVCAGKAHRGDREGKQIIQELVHIRDSIPNVKVAFLPNYDMSIAKKMVAGVDLWLNTPRRPLEASGTSGMKAAHNGVPHLSTLDGWWIEGHYDGLTGWSIGSEDKNVPSNDRDDADDLYRLLENDIYDAFQDRKQWMKIMKATIAFNASFFNSHRMVQQYVLKAYFR